MSTPTQGPVSDDAKEVQRVIYKALADARMDHDGAKAVMVWKRLTQAGRLAERGEVGPIVERVQALVLQGDTADVIERAVEVILADEGYMSYATAGAGGGFLAPYAARALAAAGLLAASPAPESLDLEALAGVCRTYVSAWDDQHADATVLGSLARRVALAASPAAPQAAGYIIAGPDKDGRMECDWDGKVHESRADGDAELALCRETYDDWGLYAMYPVGPSAPAPADEAAGFDRTAAHTEAAADRADDEAALVPDFDVLTKAVRAWAHAHGREYDTVVKALGRVSRSRNSVLAALKEGQQA